MVVVHASEANPSYKLAMNTIVQLTAMSAIGNYGTVAQAVRKVVEGGK